MANMRIRVNGRDYELACGDGQEEHLRLLADELNDRVAALVRGMGHNPGEAMALLLTSLTVIDELIDSKRRTPAPEQPMPTQSEIMQQERMLAQMEAAMATTLDEIAQRIEKIAEQIEIR